MIEAAFEGTLMLFLLFLLMLIFVTNLRSYV